jgi:hypothetical protein
MVTSSSHAGGKSDGTRLGRYRLGGKLHDGPLGELWAARIDDGVDTGTSVLVRRVARRPAISEETAHDLVDAARAAVGLEHELFVPVLDVVSTEAEIGIVSYASEGELLRALLWRAGLKRSPVPPSVALRLALDLLEAANALREHAGHGPCGLGICADNVLVTTAGRAQLLEPGLSAFACAHDPWSHDPKWASYRAPETLRGGAPADERADVFTVAVLLWEMLRNRPLFGGSRFEAVERNVAQGAIGRADSLRPPGSETVDRALGDALARALERDPIARFPSLGEMAAALRAATDSIARADGVSAFVERLAAESLAKQRKLLDPADRSVGEPGPEPAVAVEPAHAPEPAAAAAGAGSEPGGVPDFHDLFGAPKGAAAAEPAAEPHAAPVAVAPSPSASDAGGEAAASADRASPEPAPPAVSASHPPSAGAEPASGAPAERAVEAAPESGVESAASLAAPKPSKPIPKGAFVLGAAAVLALVLLWAVGPLRGSPPVQPADTAAATASGAAAALLDAGASPSATATDSAGAPTSSATAADTALEPSDAGPQAAAGGDADAGTSGDSKTKTKGKKKKTKPKYMPGTL